MKHFLITLEEQNGEQEYRQFSTCTAKSVTSANKKADVLAKRWYDAYNGLPKKEDGGYYHLGGAIFVKVNYVTEISEDDYLVLKKYNI